MDGASVRPVARHPTELADPPEWLIAGLLAFGFVALFLIPNVPRPVTMGLVFNSMMQHMLHGRFDVDPATILSGGEVYVRDGRSYAYFGIFCALLRLPLLAIGRPDLDMTVVSIGCATLLGVWARLRAAAIAMDGGAFTRAQRAVIFTGFALSGETIQFLAPSIFQGHFMGRRPGLGVRPAGPAALPGQDQVEVAAIFGTGRGIGAGAAGRPTFGIGAYLAMAAMFTLDLWRSRARLVFSLRTRAPAPLCCS